MRFGLIMLLCVCLALPGGVMAEDTEDTGPAVISAYIAPQTQPDLTQPVFVLALTNGQTERVEVIDEAGNALARAEAPAYTESEFGRLWSVAIRFDAPYAGGLEIYPGDAGGWHEEGSLRVSVNAWQPDETAEPSAPAIPEYTGKTVRVESTVFDMEGPVKAYTRDIPVEMSGAEAYMEGDGVRGVRTFRGSNLRQNSAYGRARPVDQKLEGVWTAEVGSVTGHGGHAAQPAIVEWSEAICGMMALDGVLPDPTLREVIFAAEDGTLHFLALETGEATRRMNEPGEAPTRILSTPSVHPALPLMAVSTGDPDDTARDEWRDGVSLLNLAINADIGRLPGRNEDSLTGDPTAQTSPLFDAATDIMFTIGGNGLLYSMELGGQVKDGNVTVRPKVAVTRVGKGRDNTAVDGSMAAYAGHGYFATDAGLLVSLDLNTLVPDWGLYLGGDVDASVAVDIADGKPALYAVTTADPATGESALCRVDAITGGTDWRRPLKGSVTASPLVGTGPLAGMLYVAATQESGFGVLYALDARTGNEIWHMTVPGGTLSSPMAMYDGHDAAWLVQGCETGVMLLSPLDGEGMDYYALGGTVYGSPAAFDDIIVIATREGALHGLRLR